MSGLLNRDSAVSLSRALQRSPRQTGAGAVTEATDTNRAEYPGEVVIPGVVILVGPAASGKTSMRRRLVATGIDETLVVSFDDIRAWLQQRSRLAGRPVLRLSLYTPAALRIAAATMRDRIAEGRGYLSDNTNLQLRERLQHLAWARQAGLPAVALLMPPIELEELAERDLGRAVEQQVPARILANQHRRYGRLGPDELLREGFDAAWVVVPETTPLLRHEPPGR